MSRWFRHYAGMMRDDKLVRVAIQAKQPVERVLWVFGAILESAAEVNDGGRFDFDIPEAAYFLRTDESDIRAVVDGLIAVNRLVGDRVVNWSARQFESDRSATRQAAYRERKRAEKCGNDDTKTSGDVTVTSLSRHGDAPETETETDKGIVQIADLNTRKPARKKRTCDDPLFIEFYSAYPRRQSKQDAIKAYAQVRKSGVAHESIMRGLDRAKRGDRRFRDPQFTPLPASWLRSGGFDDEPDSNQQSAERLAFA